MINSIEQKNQAENQIKRLENILISLREKLLPDREKQYKAMASSYVNKIRELREEIDEFTGVQLFNIPKNDLNIHIIGPVIGYGEAPISLVSKFLDNFRKSIQTIYAILCDIKISTNVPKEVAKACDFNLLGYNKGSINLSLGLPPKQLNFFDSNNKIDNAMEVYFKAIHWASSALPKECIDIDENIRDRALGSILRTLPDEKNISEITFSGEAIKKYGKLSINKYAKYRISEILLNKDIDDEIIEVKGKIREVDLDNLSFTLRDIQENDYNIPNQMKCIMTEAVAEQLKDYLDSYAIIKGIRKESSNTINVKLVDTLD
ncbi:hypothetical protein [Clostridium thermopalmarium]|uniref:Uncharacterized protein n=1 Tax=Clostridium thermopalmarium DSM 5974 TaxID=1121340 RepID=A0A2T0APJ6_9CLOT|nr:hypothetical protein [Clostridium thermopalmarium]PRR70938.1 hypothetical protein CPAL_20280 [Clostridium thermopalmarium DSM 5974]PVZ28862.1 hypothetical protein LX19_00166 [Clostridium thermopalmarium DSM 5974]